MTVHIEISDSDKLSWTDRCIGGYLACGLKNSEIAARMGVTIRTVERAVVTLRTTIDAPREVVGEASADVNPVHDSPPVSDNMSPIHDNMSHKGGSVNMSPMCDNMSPPLNGTELALSDPSSSLLFPSLPSSQKDGISKKKIKTSADPFFVPFRDAFASKNPDDSRTWNWKAQGKCINDLIKRCRKQPDPETFAIHVLERFWTLTQTGDKFWKSQPFTPMNLNSEGIWTRVIKSMTVEKGLDIAAIVGGRT